MDDWLNQLTDQGYDINFSLDKDGNCQFEAIAISLNLHDVRYITPEFLIEPVVSYLRDNLVNVEYFPLESTGMFVGRPWDDYANDMPCDGTYGDQITLQTISDVSDVKFLIVSSLGPVVMF